MRSDYRYRPTGRFNSDIPQKFDFKWGCLIPLITFVVVLGSMIGLAFLFGGE